MRPDNALKSLTIFEGKFNRLKEERDNVARAKEALELSEPGICPFNSLVIQHMSLLQSFFLSLFHVCFFTPLWLIWRRKCISHIDSCRSFLVVQNCVTMTAGQVSPSQERMQVALEELADLKGVWSELARVWEQIDELKEKPWLSVAPRKVWMWKSWGFCGC